jgi:glycosyltransferase involved in cell wall biosynthesis
MNSFKVLIPLSDGGYVARGAAHYVKNCLLGLKNIDKACNYVILKDKSQNFIESVSAANMKLIDVPSPSGRIKIHLWYMFSLPKLVAKQKPDIIHFQNTYIISKKLKNVIMTIHDLAEFECPEKHGKIKSVLRRYILRKNVKRAKLVVAVSDYTKMTICKTFGISPDKVKVVKNAIDVSPFQKDIKYTLPLDKDGRELPKKYFMYAGAVEKSKNVDILVKALQHYNLNHIEKTNLVIVGNFGNKLSEVEDFVLKNGLKNNVYFTSYLNNEELVSVFKNAFAFVHPSSFEGFGIVLLQAMASGVPVIAADATSFPEVIGDAGLLYTVSSYQELSEKMGILLKDSTLYESLKEKGLTRVKMFNFEKSAKDLFDIYKAFNKV